MLLGIMTFYYEFEIPAVLVFKIPVARNTVDGAFACMDVRAEGRAC